MWVASVMMLFWGYFGTVAIKLTVWFEMCENSVDSNPEPGAVVMHGVFSK